MKKGLAIAIMDKLPPPGKRGSAKPAPKEEDEGEEDAGLVSAMAELSAALKKGDDEAAAAAFKSAVQICKGSYSEEE